MIIRYKDFNVQVAYSANTKSYYGEVLGIDLIIAFQATNRAHALQAMQRAVDAYLQADFALL